MKAILEFNLPEQEEEYRDAVEGQRCRTAFQELDNWISAQVSKGSTFIHINDLHEELMRLQTRFNFTIWQ